METSSILPISQLSIFSPKPNTHKAFPTMPMPCNQRGSQSRRLHCHKMFVPGFGEASPESKAANNLHGFFTYVAVKIVLAQLESYNPEAYKELMEFLDRNSVNDGDQFCANLMRESSRHQGLVARTHVYGRSDFCAFVYFVVMNIHVVNYTCSNGSYMAALRILEVRSAYCKNDFEWDNMKRLAVKMVDESNTRLMRDYVLETSQLEDDK
ncbi:hypothetical protein AQUCO_03200028v1 [Aquilegia coerulea]|uniref:Chaperonin-like RBCX protein 1, chloroplastic n=1 Tax=Aquilegia coerulea TaxID=218851 RepID=A0A2G5CZU6_AQUCA|nr:hypothetical protein AQUCO_03200028v1 [Aquilegia coerulea]